MSKVSKLVLTFFMMTVARWTADKILYYFNKRSIVIKLPVKRAPWFSVYNWEVAICEYKQYWGSVIFYREGDQVLFLRSEGGSKDFFKLKRGDHLY